MKCTFLIAYLKSLSTLRLRFYQYNRNLRSIARLLCLSLDYKRSYIKKQQRKGTLFLAFCQLIYQHAVRESWVQQYSGCFLQTHLSFNLSGGVQKAQPQFVIFVESVIPFIQTDTRLFFASSCIFICLLFTSSRIISSESNPLL